MLEDAPSATSATPLRGAARGGLMHAFERRRKLLWPGGGPLVSVVGFGAGRVGIDASFAQVGCFEALRHALHLGVNLIDCSAAASDGQSELLVGRVLQNVFAEHTIKREDLVLVTKVGQLAGHSFEKLLSQQMHGLQEKWTHHYAAGRAVSFSKELIREQILASMRRLGVDEIDCVLFECPETYFDAHLRPELAANQSALGERRAALVEPFHEALAGAFAALGECARQGLVKSFGVSSATLGYPQTVWNSVSLDDFVAAAHRSGSREYFRVVSLPLNWIEMTALRAQVQQIEPARRWGGDARETQRPVRASCLLEAIAAEGLGLLAHRPLNALSRGRLIRLARPRFTEKEVAAMSLAEQKGLENWVNLSLDLESMGRKVLAVPGYDDAPLSQMVLSSLASLPELSAVLLGMRRKTYVEDALEALTRPKLLNGKDLLAEIHDQLEFEPG